MRNRTTVALTIATILLSTHLPAQQPSPSTLFPLQESIIALLGQSTIQDVTLSGSAELIAGSSDQTSPIVLEALSSAGARMDIALASGVWSEIRTMSGSVPSGTWTSGDGVQHPIPQHNQMTDAAWFFPPMVLTRMVSNSAITVNYIGQEGSQLHFQAIEQASGTVSSPTSLIQHLTQMDVYLDSTTLLPTKFAFNVHPDNNASVDIPVTILYQNYQSTSGITLPFHLQKYINNSLALDIQIQAVAFNTGLTANSFSAQ